MTNEKEKNEILYDTNKLFDVSKIVKQEDLDSSGSVAQSLEKCSDLAKLKGNLSPSDDFEDLKDEYEVFAERVKDLAPEYLYKEETAKKVSSKRMLESPPLYKDIGNVLHLALTALCRTHCEAVVEGMGSFLCSHSQHRKSLNVSTVDRETIIRWQGPHPGKGVTKLIEARITILRAEKIGILSQSGTKSNII